jgi:hypothetical protein
LALVIFPVLGDILHKLLLSTIQVGEATHFCYTHILIL